MRKRNWLVEDNLVALYIALHGYKDLKYDLYEICEIIPHKSFQMRIQNYVALNTNGKKGLTAALGSPLYKELYRIFNNFGQQNFASLINRILEVKYKVSMSYSRVGNR